MFRFVKRAAPLFTIALAVTLLLNGNSLAEEEITYRLKWLINMSTVGDVFAKHQGYFKRQGLSVTLKPGGPERDAIRELELGYAQFGVASADQVIKAVAKGAPVVVIAQLFQSNPLRWIYFTDKVRLDTLGDLKGRTIGVTFGKNDEFIMRTLLAEAGLTDADVRLYSVRLDYLPFYRKRVDLWPVYINTQGVDISTTLQQSGEKIAYLDPNAYGVHFVANSVVTSESLVAEKPQLVRRFLTALMDGWRAALDPDHTQAAIAVVQTYDRDTTRSVLETQWKETRLLVRPAQGKKLGTLDVPAWKQTERIMLQYHQIDRPVHIEKHLVNR